MWIGIYTSWGKMLL